MFDIVQERWFKTKKRSMPDPDTDPPMEDDPPPNEDDDPTIEPK